MLGRYEDFLLHNASQITAVESSLRSITYFLPGRFPDSELAGEAIYSALNLLGLYHDSILVRLLSPHPAQRGLAPGAAARSTGGGPSSASSSSLATGAVATSFASSGGAPAPPATYSKLQHTPSEHARYTHFFSDASTTYNSAARALVIIGYGELLAEMLARRKLGEKRAWNVVAGIEAVKAALRLALVHLTKDRPLIQPPIPEREVDPAMLEEDRKAAMSNLASTATASSALVDEQTTSRSTLTPEIWRGSRTGYMRPTLSSIRLKAHPPAPGTTGPYGLHSKPRHPLAQRSLGGTSSPSRDTSGSGSGSDSDETLVDSFTDKDVNDYLLSRTLTPNDVKRPEELVRQLRDGVGYTAELIWILRPLIYVIALRRWGHKHKAPFAISLALECLAGMLRKRSLSQASGAAGDASSSLFSNPLLLAMMGGGESSILGLLASFLSGGGSKSARPVSDVEKLEWEKRNRAFWWYLLRGPMWYSFTRPRLERIVHATEKRPLLGVVGGIVGDYLPLVDDYYYYSAT